MIERDIYLESGILLCNNGNESIILDDSFKIHDVFDGIINEHYSVSYCGKNLILRSKNYRIILHDYSNIFSHKHLSFLDYDIKKVMLNSGFFRLSDVSLKGLIKYIFRKATCISLVLSIYCSLFPTSIVASNKKVSNTSNSTSLSDSEMDDEEYSSIKNGEVEVSENVLIDEEELPTNSNNLYTDSVETNEVVVEKYSDEDIEKVFRFMNYNHLSIDGFSSLLYLMTSEDGPFGVLYSSYEDAIDALIQDEISYQVKFLTIMVREGNTYEELDKMCAGVVGESHGSGECYDDAYAVASTLINRTHKDSYVNKYGQRLYDQFCAPGQYEVEASGLYKDYLGQIDLDGYHAAIDAFYTRESMHDYIEFRASWVQLSKYETFVTGGNKFIAKMKESQYVPYPDEEIVLDDVKELVLNRTN